LNVYSVDDEYDKISEKSVESGDEAEHPKYTVRMLYFIVTSLFVT